MDKNASSLPNRTVKLIRIFSDVLVIVLLLSSSLHSHSAQAAAQSTLQTPGSVSEKQEIERLKNEGQQAREKKDAAAADRTFRLGYARAQAIGDKQSAAYFLNNLGNVYLDERHYDQATDYYSRAVAMRESMNLKAELASSLHNLGLAYSRTEQHEKALGLYLRVLSIYKELNDNPKIARDLFDIANEYGLSGQYDKALDYDVQSLSVYKNLGNKLFVADRLRGIGLDYYMLGQYDTAIEYIQKSQSEFEAIGEPGNIAAGLVSMAVVYYSSGEASKALDLFLRAQSVMQAQGNKAFAESLNHGIGAAYFSLHQYQKALDYMTRAQAAYESRDDKAGMSSSLNGIGRCWANLGQYDKALDCHQQALEIYKVAGDKRGVAESLENIADCYLNLGKGNEAEATFDKALEINDAMIEQAGEASAFGDFVSAIEDNFYARYASALAILKKPTRGLLIAERGRGQGLSRQIARSNIDFTRFLSAEDARQLKKYTADLEVANRQMRLMEDRPMPVDPAGQSAVEHQCQEARQLCREAERQYTLFRDVLLARHPEYRRLRNATPISQEQLTNLAQQNSDTLYLEYALVNDSVGVMFALSKKDGCKAYLLAPTAETFSHIADVWRKSLVRPTFTESSTEREQAKRVYSILLGSVEKAGLLKPGRYSRLVIVADGPLLGLPFSALVDNSGKRLIERYAVSNTISLGVLTWPSSPRMSRQSLLCIVDPTGFQAERFQNPPMVSRLRDKFEPLKYARSEAKKITMLFPKTVGLAGTMAREAVVKQQIGTFAILHFATHGVLDAKDGLRSWLLLASEPPESAEDGRLEAREIMGLPLSAQLAVLSACETGLGRQSATEGLIGLAWAFRAAGCSSVVASQWKVDDEATGRLMELFYRNLKAGQRKDDALRAAIMSVRKQKGYSAPFWWAAFQVIGETRPLRL